MHRIGGLVKIMPCGGAGPNSSFRRTLVRLHSSFARALPDPIFPESYSGECSKYGLYFLVFGVYTGP